MIGSQDILVCYCAAVSAVFRMFSLPPAACFRSIYPESVEDISVAHRVVLRTSNLRRHSSAKPGHFKYPCGGTGPIHHAEQHVLSQGV